MTCWRRTKMVGITGQNPRKVGRQGTILPRLRRIRRKAKELGSGRTLTSRLNVLSGEAQTGELQGWR